jgi:ssDNA-binding Zn-finger/Zn-ribbon topoisomerase 1
MEPLTVISSLGIFLLLMAAAVARLDVGHCSECPHCRAEAELRAARERAAVAALDRRWDVGRCPRCGRTGPHDHDL